MLNSSARSIRVFSTAAPAQLPLHTYLLLLHIPASVLHASAVSSHIPWHAPAHAQNWWPGQQTDQQTTVQGGCYCQLRSDHNFKEDCALWQVSSILAHNHTGWRKPHPADTYGAALLSCNAFCLATPTRAEQGSQHHLASKPGVQLRARQAFIQRMPHTLHLEPCKLASFAAHECWAGPGGACCTMLAGDSAAARLSLHSHPVHQPCKGTSTAQPRRLCDGCWARTQLPEERRPRAARHKQPLQNVPACRNKACFLLMVIVCTRFSQVL
ncbi:hypothetical protein COO60DRAFT_1477276 [Scenedesmus sp. NREL 46B-D3]|nr:hypothetical protein COO60DRAFT_1477276 [Scenedesmus sp. NREL 46B-D3]